MSSEACCVSDMSGILICHRMYWQTPKLLKDWDKISDCSREQTGMAADICFQHGFPLMLVEFSPVPSWRVVVQEALLKLPVCKGKSACWDLRQRLWYLVFGLGLWESQSVGSKGTALAVLLRFFFGWMKPEWWFDPPEKRQRMTCTCYQVTSGDLARNHHVSKRVRLTVPSHIPAALPWLSFHYLNKQTTNRIKHICNTHSDIFCIRDLAFGPLFFWFKEDNSRWCQISEGSSFTLSPLQALHPPLRSASQQIDFSALFPFSDAPFNVFLSVNNSFRSKLNSKPIVDQHIDLQEDL